MPETIVIGEILKPQGVRGEVKVKPLLDDAADMRHFKKVYIGSAPTRPRSKRADITSSTSSGATLLPIRASVWGKLPTLSPRIRTYTFCTTAKRRACFPPPTALSSK